MNAEVSDRIFRMLKWMKKSIKICIEYVVKLILI